MTQTNGQPKAERRHYFLVAGELVFRTKESEVPNAVRMNTVVMSADGKLPAAQIGRAQQALQLHFFQRMQDPELKVVDVVILSLMPLGEFTPEEFNATPPGLEKREMAPAGNA